MSANTARPSLTQQLRAHEARAAERRQRLGGPAPSLAKAVGVTSPVLGGDEISRAVAPVADSLLDSVNSGVAQVFANQRVLEAETRQLRQESQRFSKQTGQWLQLTTNFGNALKELGDVENWAQAIEEDLKAITEVLERSARENGLPAEDRGASTR